MKFGIRECANIVFRAKQKVKIGDKVFEEKQPVLYIDSATTSSEEQSTSTVYAQGGRGNSRLIAWEGDKTLTFTVEDALLSPVGYAILSGAGLFKHGSKATDEVHYHMTTMAKVDKDGKLDLTNAIAKFGKDGNKNKGYICDLNDAPVFILAFEDGDLTGDQYSDFTLSEDKQGFTFTTTKDKTVMVDYYVVLPGANVYEADITADTFAGYYYVEADTLFRRQADGKDLPANLTFPNVKLQSAFTITMAGSGDPSTFTFTFDAFPGYTYFDETKKVLSVLQVVDDIDLTDTGDDIVMPHPANVSGTEGN